MGGIRNRKEQRHMRHVPMAKNSKHRWVIIGVIIVLIAVCFIGLAVQRELVQNAGGKVTKIPR